MAYFDVFILLCIFANTACGAMDHYEGRSVHSCATVASLSLSLCCSLPLPPSPPLSPTSPTNPTTPWPPYDARHRIQRSRGTSIEREIHSPPPPLEFPECRGFWGCIFANTACGAMDHYEGRSVRHFPLSSSLLSSLELNDTRVYERVE